MRQTHPFYSLLFQIVTMSALYNVDMNILTVFPVKGFLFTLLLFAFCFVGVHIIMLARTGWEYQQKHSNEPQKDEEPPKTEEKKPSSEREPIYYIVERKTRRAKSTYGEPKQINFKP